VCLISFQTVFYGSRSDKTSSADERELAETAAEALTLQLPLPDGALRIVARGKKRDEPVC